MALTPEQIREIRTKAGLTPELPTSTAANPNLARQRVQEFQAAMGEFDQDRSADTSGALFPAKTGEGPAIAGLKAAGNIPSSAVNLAKNFYQVLRHPIQTGRVINDATLGGLDHLLEKFTDLKGDPEQMAVAKQVGNELMRRYGSLEALQRTATNDPVGFATDILTLAAPAKAPLTAVAKLAAPARTAARTAVAQTLEKSAAKSITKVLDPTKEAMKVQTQRVAPELAKRKKIAVSRQGLEGQVADELEASGQAIDQAWSALPEGTREQVAPILDALEESKNRFVVDGVTVEPGAWRAADELQKVMLEVSKGEDTIPSESLRRVRQIWDETIDKSRGFTRDLSDQDKLAIKREATTAIRNVLAEAHPDIKRLNKEYTLWKTTDDILTETIKRRTGREASLTTKGAAGVGISGGYVTGGVKQAAIAAAIMTTLAVAIRSTLWRTLSAAAKQSLAEAIYADKPAEVQRILTPLLGEQAVDITTDAQEI